MELKIRLGKRTVMVPTIRSRSAALKPSAGPKRALPRSDTCGYLRRDGHQGAAPDPILSGAPLDRQSTGIPLKHEVSNSITPLGLEQNTLPEVNCEQTSGNARVHARIEECL